MVMMLVSPCQAEVTSTDEGQSLAGSTCRLLRACRRCREIADEKSRAIARLGQLSATRRVYKLASRTSLPRVCRPQLLRNAPSAWDKGSTSTSITRSPVSNNAAIF